MAKFASFCTDNLNRTPQRCVCGWGCVCLCVTVHVGVSDRYMYYVHDNTCIYTCICINIVIHLYMSSFPEITFHHVMKSLLVLWVALIIVILSLPTCIQGRRDLKTVIHCYGGGACNINFNTATKAGEVGVNECANDFLFLFLFQVVQKLQLGLQITGENNRFALFEAKNNEYFAIDDRTMLADVLAKFEKYVINLYQSHDLD